MEHAEDMQGQEPPPPEPELEPEPEPELQLTPELVLVLVPSCAPKQPQQVAHPQAQQPWPSPWACPCRRFPAPPNLDASRMPCRPRPRSCGTDTRDECRGVGRAICMCQTASCERVGDTEIDACWALPFCVVAFLHPASRCRDRSDVECKRICRIVRETWQYSHERNHLLVATVYMSVTRVNHQTEQTVAHLRRVLAGGRSLPWSHTDRASDNRS